MKIAKTIGIVLVNALPTYEHHSTDSFIPSSAIHLDLHSNYNHIGLTALASFTLIKQPFPTRPSTGLARRAAVEKASTNSLTRDSKFERDALMSDIIHTISSTDTKTRVDPSFKSNRPFNFTQGSVNIQSNGSGSSGIQQPSGSTQPFNSNTVSTTGNNIGNSNGFSAQMSSGSLQSSGNGGSSTTIGMMPQSSGNSGISFLQSSGNNALIGSSVNSMLSTGAQSLMSGLTTSPQISNPVPNIPSTLSNNIQAVGLNAASVGSAMSALPNTMNTNTPSTFSSTVVPSNIGIPSPGSGATTSALSFPAVAASLNSAVGSLASNSLGSSISAPIPVVPITPNPNTLSASGGGLAALPSLNLAVPIPAPAAISLPQVSSTIPQAPIATSSTSIATAISSPTPTNNSPSLEAVIGSMNNIIKNLDGALNKSTTSTSEISRPTEDSKFQPLAAMVDSLGSIMKKAAEKSINDGKTTSVSSASAESTANPILSSLKTIQDLLKH